MNTTLALDNYNTACDHIAELFCDHMWYDYDDWERAAPTYPPHVFNISDTFWTIENMYMTLEYNMPSEVVFDWYWATVEQGIKINLYHYYLQWNNKQDWLNLHHEN